MKDRIRIAVIILVIAVLFVIAGIPALRYLKEHKPENIFSSNGSSFFNNGASMMSGRNVTIDLSVEDACSDPVTGTVDIECLSADGCRKMCDSKGCSSFGLKFLDSEFKGNRCYCICFEQNEIQTQTALPTGGGNTGTGADTGDNG